MRSHLPLTRTRLRVESLEDRTVPTTANLANDGVLTLLGTGNADTIQITQTNGTISISGVAQTFSASGVNTIVIDGSEGNDTITVAANIATPTWIYGGGGSDTIRGGAGVNHIYGAGGNDTIVGGSGADAIYGGVGSNNVSAPAGASVTAGSPYAAGSLSAVAQQIVDMVNQFRASYAAQHGISLAPLSTSGQLTAMAQMHSNNMVGQVPFQGYSGAMSHTLYGTNQPTLTSRANFVGYDYLALGENIAYGYADAESVFNAWINSPGHLANIVNASYTNIGVAVAYTGSGVPYWTQEFGLPSAINPPPPQVLPPSGFGGGPSMAGHIYAVGSDAGRTPMVTVYDAASGAVKFYFAAYDVNFRGGVRVATGDINGDGKEDIVVAPGASMGSLIRIYDGVTGQEIRNFYAYNPAFGGGVNIAVGDVNGDGRGDIITGADATGGPHVQVFDGVSNAVIRSFFAYNPSFTGGVRVAAGDVNGDGRADIITGAGATGGPHVQVFDGTNLAVLRSFFAYAPTFTGGVYVSTGDVNGDGRVDIITGAGANGGPHVKAFSGVNLAELASFFASTPTFTGGVRVRAMDLTGDGRAEILAGTGFGNRELRVYNGTGSAILASFLAGDPANMGGVFVG